MGCLGGRGERRVFVGGSFEELDGRQGATPLGVWWEIPLAPDLEMLHAPHDGCVYHTSPPATVGEQVLCPWSSIASDLQRRPPKTER